MDNRDEQGIWENAHQAWNKKQEQEKWEKGRKAWHNAVPEADDTTNNVGVPYVVPFCRY